MWDDGSTLKPGDFSNWAAGSLLHSVDDCVSLDAGKNGKWVDYLCSTHLLGLLSAAKSYVCEYDTKMSVQTTQQVIVGK